MIFTPACGPVGSDRQVPDPNPLSLPKRQLLVWSAEARARKRRAFSNARPLATGLEKHPDLFRKNPFTGYARLETRIIQLFTATKMPDSAEHLLFAIGKMFLQPALEQRRDRVR